MLPKWHILFGFVFSYILVYFFNISLFAGIIIFLSSVLIDVDHYFYYVVKNKNYNFRRFYSESIEYTKEFRKLSLEQRKKYRRNIFIFHGIEFWIFLFILSFYNKLFLWILIGIFIHMLADFVEIIHEKEPFYAKFSQIYVYETNRSKEEFV